MISIKHKSFNKEWEALYNDDDLQSKSNMKNHGNGIAFIVEGIRDSMSVPLSLLLVDRS